MEVQQLGNYVLKEKNENYESKIDFENIPVPKDLSELVKNLNQVFSKDVVDVDYVKKMMENYKSNIKDWRQYAKYDPHRYTRTLIDEGNGKYNILLLCWAESQGSSIHDHSDAHCFMKCLDGELVETKYEWPKNNDANSEKEMVEKCRTVLKKNEVCYINDDIGLHRVENVSNTKPGISLHVYIPPFSECKGFDQQTGKYRVCQIKFASKNETQITES